MKKLLCILHVIPSDPEATTFVKDFARTLIRAIKTEELLNAPPVVEGGDKLDPTYKLVCDIQAVLNPNDYPGLADRVAAWQGDWLKGRFSRAIPLIIFCPMCHARHVDKGKFATHLHHTHTCQNPMCGFTWRPAKEYTVGVQFLPGFQDEVSK